MEKNRNIEFALFLKWIEVRTISDNSNKCTQAVSVLSKRLVIRYDLGVYTTKGKPKGIV